jgi:hypothetical protein
VNIAFGWEQDDFVEVAEPGLYYVVHRNDPESSDAFGDFATF